MRRLAIAVLLLPGMLATGQQVDFLHITDTHVMRIEGIHPALLPLRQANLLTAPQLEGFLEGLKTNPPAFILHTGDILEAFRYDSESGGALNGQIERFKEIAQRSPAPMHLVLGNRDVSWYRQADGKQAVLRDSAITSEARAAWREAFDCFRDGTWYSFEKQAGGSTFRFAVLDNGDTADPELASRQIQWLQSLLAKSTPAALVLAVHIPLGANAFGRSVREVLAGFDRPVLVLAGHNHTDGIEELAPSPRKLQVRTASFAGGKMGARRIVLKPDGIEVYATSEPSKLLFALPVPVKAR
jgi:3',5'-cyclic AMP phosphodiesterase CpdA